MINPLTNCPGELEKADKRKVRLNALYGKEWQVDNLACADKCQLERITKDRDDWRAAAYLFAFITLGMILGVLFL